MRRIRYGISLVASLALLAGMTAQGDEKTSAEKTPAGSPGQDLAGNVTVTGLVKVVKNKQGALSLIALLTKDGVAYSIKTDENGKKLTDVPKGQTVVASGTLVEEAVGQGDMAHKRKTLTIKKYSIVEQAVKAESAVKSEAAPKTEAASKTAPSSTK